MSFLEKLTAGFGKACNGPIKAIQGLAAVFQPYGMPLIGDVMSEYAVKFYDYAGALHETNPFFSDQELINLAIYRIQHHIREEEGYGYNCDLESSLEFCAAYRTGPITRDEIDDDNGPGRGKPIPIPIYSR